MSYVPINGRAAVSLSVVFVVAALTLHAYTQPFDQDEEQYVTGAHLALSLTIYRDFLFLQPPVYPILVSSALAAFGGLANPFVIARTISAAMAVGSVVIFYLIARRVSLSGIVAFVLSVLFATSPLMLRAFGSTRNDVMAVFFGLVAIGLLIDGPGREARFACGICSALAVGTKLTSAFIPVAGLVYLAVFDRRALPPFVVGGLVGSLPLIYFALLAPDQFIYGLLTFHTTAPAQWYTDAGLSHLLTWEARVKSVAGALSSEPMLIIALMFLALSGVTIIRQRLFNKMPAETRFLAVVAFPALLFVLAPNPWWTIYLQPIVPYLLLGCASLWPVTSNTFPRTLVVVFGVLAVAIAALQVSRFVIVSAQRAAGPWTVTQVRDLSNAIVARVSTGPIATLYPLLALDAGGEIYPEFSTGIYFFRSGNHVSPSRVRELRAAAPATLPTLLAKRPPAAILASSHPLDRPLIEWANRNGYVEMPLPNWRGRPYDEGWVPTLFVPSTDGSGRGLSSGH